MEHCGGGSVVCLSVQRKLCKNILRELLISKDGSHCT